MGESEIEGFEGGVGGGVRGGIICCDVFLCISQAT